MPNPFIRHLNKKLEELSPHSPLGWDSSELLDALLSAIRSSSVGLYEGGHETRNEGDFRSHVVKLAVSGNPAHLVEAIQTFLKKARGDFDVEVYCRVKKVGSIPSGSLEIYWVTLYTIERR